MSSERLDRIGIAMRRYVDDGRIAGMVTLVARHGKVVYANVVGDEGPTNDTAMARDTLFRIYSMTKPITGGLVSTADDEHAILRDVVSMIQLMDSPWLWDNELKALTYQAITKLN